MLKIKYFRNSRFVFKGQNKTIELLVQLSGIGWFIAISIAGFAFLGVWIDSLIGLKPIGVIVGMLLPHFAILTECQIDSSCGGPFDSLQRFL